MKDEVKILNHTQVRCYLKDGVTPKRVELGYNDKLVFIYDRVETEKLFTKWINHEYENYVNMWFSNKNN
jgi:hypothetical protein